MQVTEDARTHPGSASDPLPGVIKQETAEDGGVEMIWSPGLHGQFTMLSSELHTCREMLLASPTESVSSQLDAHSLPSVNSSLHHPTCTNASDHPDVTL